MLDENDVKHIKTLIDTAIVEKVKIEALEGAGGSGMSEEKKSGSKDEPWYETLMFTNAKRTYDEYQDIALASARRSQSHLDTLNQLSVQALQNAVETANLIGKNTSETANLTGKQGVAHRDIAIDNEWNPVQQGTADTMLARTMTLDDASIKAIGAALAVAIAAELTKAKE